MQMITKAIAALSLAGATVLAASKFRPRRKLFIFPAPALSLVSARQTMASTTATIGVQAGTTADRTPRILGGETDATESTTTETVMSAGAIGAGNNAHGA